MLGVESPIRPEDPLSKIMTEAVVVIHDRCSVSEALACFAQYGIHHLPVVNNGRLVGMISSADLLTLDCFAPTDAVDRAAWLDERFTIKQLMRGPVMSLRPHSSLSEACAMLIEGGVHAAPIVDEADHLVGMVTTTDIIRCLLHGPPRKLSLSDEQTEPDNAPAGEPPVYHRKPTEEQYVIAMHTAEMLHVEGRDPRYLGKSMLYLDQRCARVARVLDLADRFLRTGQEPEVHALLLKAIHAAKRAEENATGQARVRLQLD